MLVRAFINSLFRSFPMASRNSVRVLLSGGPDWVAVPTVWEVASLRDEPKVKILCGNAYEHFEFSGSYSLHGGERLPVYRWCRRTYVAE
ncbi:DUF5988 family protein [Streptomyces flaveolus]|uniref:DUF5988 family protein n=1 Tax=Streptomyces flaveolus TaxID=67297 RepID=UPI0033B5E0E5